jgi:hypothetical protein
MARIRYSILALPFLALLLAGTEGCGDRFDTSTLGVTGKSGTFGDTAYVLQTPVWNGFAKPTDVHVGYEPFIYVAEAGANRITMLDLSGALVGYSTSIKNPVALSQDHRLNLIVCGEFDTTISGTAATFGAIYKLDLVSAGHNIANAKVTRVYFDALHATRRFTGVAVLADNSYYVTRTGPNNGSFLDPDDAVLLFDKHDALTPRVNWPLLSADGTGLTTITQPTAIATLPKPSSDFLFTQMGAKSLFRAQWITQRTTGDVTQWESYFTPARDGDISFLRVSLFKQPEDIAVDPSGNIFVIDAETDSLYKFNPSGFITQAFGGAAAMKHPQGVAFFDKTLYIADTDNNRVLRYVLSTDIK